MYLSENSPNVLYMRVDLSLLHIILIKKNTNFRCTYNSHHPSIYKKTNYIMYYLNISIKYVKKYISKGSTLQPSFDLLRSTKFEIYLSKPYDFKRLSRLTIFELPISWIVDKLTNRINRSSRVGANKPTLHFANLVNYIKKWNL